MGKAHTQDDTTKAGARQAQDLVAWYRTHHRRLPWRAAPGQTMDPYRVWLSEIMLQQTTVVTVRPYFEKFIQRWPTVHDLARATEDQVLAAWAGLGYYRRARYLHACAQELSEQGFPITAAEWQKLPGIGPYTSRAIGAMALGERVVPVDGNIERVASRLFRLKGDIKKQAGQVMQNILDAAPSVFPGDFAQGLMDLGATVCTPKNPSCGQCPLIKGCQAYARHQVDRYPPVAIKAPKPTRQGQAYVIVNAKGEIFVTQRPDQGLLAGMMGLPTTDWVEDTSKEKIMGNDDKITLSAVSSAKAGVQKKTKNWAPTCVGDTVLDTRQVYIGTVRHSFTHFNLVLDVMTARPTRDKPRLDGTWVSPDRMKDVGLPKVFLKAWQIFEQQIRVKK